MKQDRKNIWIKLLLVVVYILLFPTVIIPLAVSAALYEIIFRGRSNRITPDLSIADYPDLRERKASFYSGKNKLSGAFFDCKQAAGYRAVIVLGHGIGCSRDGYLNRVAYFARKGYLVYAFDLTASVDSEGKTLRGLPQAQLDLERAVAYVQASQEARGLPLFVYGHSWSGYASAAMLNDKPQGIAAVATLSGFNDSFASIYVQGYRYAGNLILCAKPWINLYQRLKFGKRAGYRGMDGINAYGGRVLVAHSKDDPTVPYDISVCAHRAECTNPNAEFIVFDDRGHTLSRPVESEKRITLSAKGKRYDAPRNGSNIFQYNVSAHYAWAEKADVYAIDETFMDLVDDFYTRAIEATRSVEK